MSFKVSLSVLKHEIDTFFFYIFSGILIWDIK